MLSEHVPLYSSSSRHDIAAEICALKGILPLQVVEYQLGLKEKIETLQAQVQSLKLELYGLVYSILKPFLGSIALIHAHNSHSHHFAGQHRLRRECQAKS